MLFLWSLKPNWQIAAAQWLSLHFAAAKPLLHFAHWPASFPLGPPVQQTVYQDKPRLHWSQRKQGKPDWYFGLRFQSYACAESTGPWCLLILTVCVLFSFVFPCAFGLKSGLLKVEKMPKIPGARLVKGCCQECRHLKQGKEGPGARACYCNLG